MDKVRLLKKLDRFIGEIIARWLPAAVRTYPEDIAARHFKNILVIRPGGMGDAILLLPSLRALKEGRPDMELTVLAEKRNQAVFAMVPWIERIVCYDRPMQFLRLFGRSFDLVIDTEQWHLLAAIIARLLANGAPVIGFLTRPERERLLHLPLPYSQDDWEADSFARLFSPVIGRAVSMRLPFFLAKARQQAGRLLTTVAEPFIVLFPGASIAARCWGEKRLRAVARQVAARNIGVVVIGGRQEKEMGERIVAGISGTVNLASRTSLAETAAVISESAMLLSGDSGVLHLAAALDKPTVSIFGPSSPEKWAPKGAHHLVLRSSLSCSPCMRYGSMPPCTEGVRCLREITVDQVAAAVFILLDQVNTS